MQAKAQAEAQAGAQAAAAAQGKAQAATQAGAQSQEATPPTIFSKDRSPFQLINDREGRLEPASRRDQKHPFQVY